MYIHAKLVNYKVLIATVCLFNTYLKLTQLTQNLPELPKTSQSYPKPTRFTRNLPDLPRTYRRGHINVKLVFSFIPTAITQPFLKLRP